MNNEVILRELYGVATVLLAGAVSAVVTAVAVAVLGVSAYYTFIGVMLFLIVSVLVAGAIQELEQKTNSGAMN